MQSPLPPAYESGPIPAGGATRVLVIARDPLARDRAENIGLASRTIHLSTAVSVDQAVAARDPADVIFLDVSAAEHLDHLAEQVSRLRALRPQAAAVAITSLHDDLQFRIAAARAGADLFLVQPVGKHAMRDAIHQLRLHHRRPVRRVLVIDDDVDFVDQMQELLTGVGYLAVGHTDPAPMLESLRRLHPDAVLLDLGMPRYDGLELTAMMRNSPEFATTPILFVSGNRDPRMARAAFAAGADDFLLKPVSTDDLTVRLDARIERSRQLRLAAERDPLTGLLTRAPFYAALDNRVASSLRNHQPLCLCLIDLDSFKRVNDRHGHQAGDEVLAAFGQLVRDCFRAEDLKCRWGGEEFALAFPAEYKVPVVHELIERLLQRFAGLRFDGQGRQFAVTFSAGIARMDPSLVDTDGLIRLADERLYRAKHIGRAEIVSDA